MNQSCPVAPGQSQLDTPEQIIHQRQIPPGVGAAICTVELRLCHDLCPGSLQKADHQFRDVLVLLALMKIFGQTVCQQVSLLSMEHRPSHFGLMLALCGVIARPAVLEFAQHLCK